MGVNESHESATSTLQALTSITDSNYSQAMEALVKKTKFNLQMQVTKWDLLSLLKLSSS